LFSNVFIDEWDFLLSISLIVLPTCRKWNSKNLHKGQMLMPNFAQ
jgi:hypothetical protein